MENSQIEDNQPCQACGRYGLHTGCEPTEMALEKKPMVYLSDDDHKKLVHKLKTITHTPHLGLSVSLVAEQCLHICESLTPVPPELADAIETRAARDHADQEAYDYEAAVEVEMDELTDQED